VSGRLAAGVLAVDLTLGLAVALTLSPLPAQLPRAPAAGPFGLEWPHWGEEITLSDLRRTFDLHPPAWVERWLYNPRERTALALERLESGDAEGALEAFEIAGRIDPDDPRVLFGLGTGRLLADHGDAVGALERSLGPADGHPSPTPGRVLPRGLRQPAFYNLGNARLAAKDNAGAVAAFEEALRLDPSDRAAKFNLELALRRLDEERLRLLPPREAPGGRRSGDEEPGEESGGSDSERRTEEDRGGAGREPGQAGPEAETEPREGVPFGHRPLAGFDEQDDLTAAQAAALLEAVENLERRLRQVEAKRAAREAATEEEDW
jgi:tetratricopeptide (TPR) repeat protein